MTTKALAPRKHKSTQAKSSVLGAEDKKFTLVRLKISLVKDPSIWRIVDVSARCPLDRLHRVIQAAMGWDNYHCYQFLVTDQDGELFATYNDPALIETAVEQEAYGVELWPLIEPLEDQLFYLYDMGDKWLHRIEVLECFTSQKEAQPYCRDGARACPPEDASGMELTLPALKRRGFLNSPESDF